MSIKKTYASAKDQIAAAYPFILVGKKYEHCLWDHTQISTNVTDIVDTKIDGPVCTVMLGNVFGAFSDTIECDIPESISNAQKEI